MAVLSAAVSSGSGRRAWIESQIGRSPLRSMGGRQGAPGASQQNVPYFWRGQRISTNPTRS
jgi:hypothetical protein